MPPRRIQVRADDSLETARDRVRQLSPSVRAQGVEVVLEPWYNPVTDNVFVDCRKALVQLGWKRESVAKVLPHLEMSNNVVLVSSPGKACAKPDPRLPATAFVTMTNALDEVFVDASRGDFRLKPDSPVAKRMARGRCQ